MRRALKPAAAVVGVIALAVAAVLWLRSGDALPGVGDGEPRIAERIELAFAPKALAVIDGTAFVADADGRLYRFDDGEIAALRSARGPAPSDIAAGFDSLWLGSFASGRVVRLSTENGRRLGAPVPVGDSVTAIAVGERLVWAAAGADGIAGGIRPLAAAAYAGSSLVALSSQFPKGAVLSGIATEGTTVWVSDGALDRVYRLEGRAVFPADSIPVGRRPVAVATGYGSVWVANADDGTVSRIDPRGRQPRTRSIRVGGELVDIATGEDGVWVLERKRGRLLRIDPDDSRVTNRFALGAAPEAIAVGDGSVWAIRAGLDRDELVRIEP